MFVLFIFVMISIMGCSTDDPVSSERCEYRETTVSLSRALENAESFFAEIEGETRTSRKIESVSVITDSKATRGAVPDTLLYLVNYEGCSGFALLGADERMSDIYAISPEGHLEYADTIGFAPLRYILEDAETHARASLLSTPISFGNGIRYVVTEKLTPAIKDFTRNWDQNPPYNNYCKLPGGQSYPGCMAVAVGIYLTFNKWPASYNNYVFQWDLLSSDNHLDEVAKFLKRLGNSDLLSMTYTLLGAGTSNNRIRPTFTNLNYSIQDEYFDIALNGNVNLLKKCLAFQNPSDNSFVKMPVLMTGYYFGTDNVDHGHAWLVDGFADRSRQTYNKNTGVTISSIKWDTLYHIIWGWRGKYNGYYRLYDDGSVDSERVLKEDYENVNDTILPGGRHYDRNLRFFGRMMPNK